VSPIPAAVPGARPRPSSSISTPAAVRREPHPGVARAGVPPDVGEGLLHHAGNLDGPRPAQVRREVGPNRQLERAPGRELSVQLHDRLQGAGEGLPLRPPEAQVVDSVPDTGNRAPKGLHLARRLGLAVGALGHPGDHLQGLEGVGEVLQDDVVQLTGDAAALGLPNLA
jgi:hypothetical protein